LYKGFFADFRGFLSYLLHATAKIGKFDLAVFISFGCLMPCLC
jgi:hypothetical protein